MRDPLLLPLAAFASGIVLERLVSFEPGEFAAVFAALAVVQIVSWFWSTPRTSRVCALVLLAWSGSAWAQWRRPGPPPSLDAGAGEAVLLEGCVVTPPVFSAVREQFVIELAERARARVTVWLKDDEAPLALAYGQRVEIAGRVRKPRNFRNPGAFDFAAFLAQQHIFWTVSATSGRSVRRLEGRCGSSWTAAIYRMRTEALRRIERLYGPDGYSAAMMQALLFGEASHVEKVWTDHFRRTGTFHALVVSGLHVSLAAGVLLFAWRIAGLPREWGMALAAAAAWFYVLLCGWQTPALRAASGFTLFTVAGLFYRRGRVLNLLAAVAFVFLIASPHEIFEASFQFSFLSVAAIGAIAAPVLRQIEGVERGLQDPERDLRLTPRCAQFRVELRLLAETMALWRLAPGAVCTACIGALLRTGVFVYGMAVVTIAVQAGLLLPMILYFHRAPVTGLTANLIAVPLLSTAVPAGLLAVVTGWRWPASLAALLLDWSRRAVDWHAALEPNWRFADPPPWTALLFAAGFLALLMLPRWRWISIPAMAACAVLLYLPLADARAGAGVLELTAIDVGQGDSLLIGFPDTRWMLVDAGGIPAFRGRPKPRLDVGEDVVSPYLWRRGIRRIDLAACTHAHEDHAGGLRSVIQNFNPREIWGGANVPALLQPRAGYSRRFGAATVEVLAPLRDYSPLVDAKNNDSLVLRIQYGRHVFLLTGDLERQMEERLIESGALARVDVLKAGHHGSKSSSTEEFVAALRPAFALISVGEGNTYRHPHPEVLARFERSRTAVLRTDTHGAITIRSDGRRLDLSTFAWEGKGWSPTPPLLPVH